MGYEKGVKGGVRGGRLGGEIYSEMCNAMRQDQGSQHGTRQVLLKSMWATGYLII